MKRLLSRLRGKLYVFLLSALTLLAAGCDEDDGVMNPPDNGSIKLTGSISGYPGGSSIARAVLQIWSPPDTFFVGIDTVDNNGSLNMLLTTPPTNFLLPASDISSSTIMVSDTTASYTGFSLLYVYTFSNMLSAVLQKKNFADTVVQGSFLVQYIFATKPFTISGADTSAFGPDTSVTSYNLNLDEGWNVMTIRQTILTTNYSKVELTDGEISGAIWRYQDVTSSILRPKILSGQKMLSIF
jgi:hypothetical protein